MHDPHGLITMLVNKAKTELLNNNLLRVYWYDGVGNSLSTEHKQIISLNDVQLRAGTINKSGQQKGVDSKIVTDLIELATNRAISDALVVTGDGDLAIGIEIAQRRGVRIAVLGVEEPSLVGHGQSPEITNIADRVVRVGRADISQYLSYNSSNQTSSSQSANSVHSAQTIDSIVANFISSQSPPIKKNVIGANGHIDGTLDKKLIYYVFSTLGKGKLSQQDKIDIRDSFKRQL